ncbi:DUF2332 family protein [Macrococcus hajekii]|uniref:DUF2332 family protein n=1 Tax=Macrococcus hajekii TaxID=198482 RepID=A0A4R6BMR2_9STAP|nr:DUF2332 family protein [Macrococcus hajekii]TDM03106.1 DUF2332 family protein [Macrococcus hajekii]GGA96009.1 hypothetical protein GCM10007190_00060 [Macrococcus hajekii]
MALKYKELMLAYSTAISDKSQLYSSIASKLAEDKDMKDILAPQIISSHFVPLFMTATLAVLYDHEHDLRRYYLNFNDEPAAFDETGYQVFKHFIQLHLAEIMLLIRTGDLKKNIVERSAVLVPIFHYIREECDRQKFNVIELGSKAGLLLNFDWYGYTFNKEYKVGFNEDINIKMKIKGYPYDYLVPLEHPHYKVGISEEVIKIEEDSDFKWMLSQFYPEELKRRKNLLKAREIFHNHPVELLEGNELELLEKTLTALPDDEPIVIFHVHHTKNWADEKKSALLQMIQRFSATKEIFHIHHQLFGTDIFIDYLDHGMLKREKLAHLDLDKMKIEWLLGQTLKI